ncbi:MAG TPA: response regulator [Bryobacteraceae bacterium]|jgi:DNA-binding NtrC family response regulator|nr:response regulator [Bryobacteraceae bacterium]
MIQPALKEGSGKVILLVDDERSLLKVMSLYLGRLGYEVRTADSTDRAWAETGPAARELDLAVLDASMPGLRAEDLAARLLAANPRLRLILSSGYPVDIGALEARAPGRVMFLHKPFLAEELAAVLRRMLGAKKEEGI